MISPRERLLCPDCQKEGLRSVVYQDRSSTTLYPIKVLYDEDGALHTENPNVTITKYHCSNGHTFKTVVPT